jgi:uncharacterized protein with PIN domain
MADKDPPINMASDRARRINSLHRSVDDIVQQQNQKRLQISSEISALTKEQQKLMAELEVERSEFTNETAEGYNKVVKGLGQAIQNLSSGVKSITNDTAKATAGAISQYSKAIGEDISINKQNTMAMALSRATPLFGYFAAKFMETSVFQDSARKIKESVSGTLSSAGESLANVFRKKEDEASEVPKMQVGGYVKKGGLAELHPAEVVTPVDKIIEVLDEMSSKEAVEKLNTLISIQRFAHDIQNSEIADKLDILITTRLNADKISSEKFEDMADALTQLKVSMVGTASQLRIAWQSMLLEHPSLKAMLAFGQTMQTVVSAPFKALFGLRGGLAGDVRNATSTSNIYQQQVNLLALIYTKSVQSLRNIEKYTHVTAEALTGEKVSPTATKSYTLFGKIKDFMTSPSEPSKPMKEKAFDFFVDSLNLDRSALEEAGIHSFTDLLTPSIILKNMGVTRANIREQMGLNTNEYYEKQQQAYNMKFDAEFKMRALKKKYEYEKQKAAKERQEFYQSVGEKLSSLVNMKRDQEEREGPHSPSMAENIAATANISKKQYKGEEKRERKKIGIFEKIKKSSKTQSEKLSRLSGGLRKIRKKMTGWFPIFFGFLSKIGSAIFSIVKPILNIAKGIGGFFGGKALLGAKNVGKAAGAIGKGAKGAYAAGGVGGALKWGAKGAMKATGLAAGALGGAVIGGGMALWDMARAIMSGDEEGFVGNFLVRGLAGFLGGRDSGFGGAASGAMKGGAIGAAIGSVVPVIGTMIGGAFGSIAGGILGFIGGKRLSEGIQNTFKGLKEIISGIWEVVSFPAKVVKETVKSLWYILEHYAKKAYDWAMGGESGVIGDMFKAAKIAVMSFVRPIQFIGGIFADYAKKFASMFSMDKVNEYIHNIMNFVPNMLFVIKDIGNIIDNWLSTAPYGIGRAYRLAKKYVKSVRSGDLSSSLKRALEGRPEPLTEKQKEGMTASEIAAYYAAEESAKEEAARKRTEKQTDELNKKTDEQTKNQVGATVSSAQIISNSNINQVNNSSNQGTWGQGWNAFSSNGASANKVATCDIN